MEGAHFRHRAASFILAAVLLAMICGPIGIATLIPAWLIGRALGMWSRKRIGGVTGDILGATSELTETAVLFILAIKSPF